MNIMDVPTPFLLISPAVVQCNIRRLADYATEHSLNVRPHTKTHKLALLGRDQLAAGAVGLTVAKVGEAEVMAEACPGTDVLLAYPALDESRRRRAAVLARQVRLRVAVDSAYAVETLAHAACDAGTTLGILVDLDVGLGRTGVQTPEAATTLAQSIDRTAGVRLDGLFCYPGHIAGPADRQHKQIAGVVELLEKTRALWRRAGLNDGIISGGSTPTAYQSHLMPPLTEIRPGTYVFNDANTLRGGYCQLQDCAASVSCTVVSDAVAGQVVVDAGSKALAADRCWPAPDSGYGYVMGYAEAKVTALSEEHGQIDMRAYPGRDRPKLGQRIGIIPNHICPCVNLHNEVWWDHGDGTCSSTPVDARGRLS